MGSHAGLIELILVFAAVLALAIWDLTATRRALEADPPPEPVAKPPAKGRSRPKRANGTPRAKPKPRPKPEPRTE